MLFLASCAKRKPRPAAPSVPLRVGQTEEGIASWYGPPYHGRVAANGEVYDMNKLTAAHRTLPFETRVRVVNLENEKHVDVRITDRGPFIDGRIIDLSREAALRIGVLLPGTARVRIEIRDLPGPAAGSTPGRGLYVVQAGAFRDRERAERVREELEREFDSVRIVPTRSDPRLWRVLVGHATSADEAKELARRARSIAGEAVVVKE
jgi:rare lipoprotein A